MAVAAARLRNQHANSINMVPPDAVSKVLVVSNNNSAKASEKKQTESLLGEARRISFEQLDINQVPACQAYNFIRRSAACQQQATQQSQQRKPI